ncbi:MAG: response regulator [Lachnospiraceae bacterium]
MYRVMLVDDEPLILAGISSMLEWPGHQCQIVGKATNGQQALERMEELQPDIVITDIKMPAMDGITFMKEAKARNYTASFILLTNLEEFSLAREAIRLGAVDYLIKLELTEEKLAHTLEEAKKSCDHHKRYAVSDGHRNAFEITREEKIRNYFREILVYDMETQVEESVYCMVEEMFQEPVVVQIHFNYGFEGFTQTFTRLDQKKVMGFAEDIISEMVRGFFDHSCLIRRDQSSFILLLSVKGRTHYQDQIRKMSEKFLLVIKDYFEVSASIAVSLKGDNIAGIAELLYQVSAMNHSYYDSGETIIFYSETCEETNRQSRNFNINFLKQDIAQSIRQNDGIRFTLIMDQVIGLLSEYKPPRPQAINGCSSLYYFILSFFDDQEEQLFPYSVDIIGQLNRMESLKDIIRWTCLFRDGVADILKRRQAVKYDKHVELAQDYVLEHYREKITLGQVADALNISQGHLSSTFKKQTGKNFSDFVNEVKAEKAKELIETHQYMMYEISDLLGFDTQYYFSTVFKKMTGYTPKEYEAHTLGKKRNESDHIIKK